jgi:copper homeostasis protein (lipoprotein)
MRQLSLLLLTTLLVACGSDPAPATDTPATVIDTIAATPVVTEWPGYYDDTLPCADCPGILTQLWVRSDSTFILRERYLDRDPLPVGRLGNWTIIYGQLALRMPDGGFMRFQGAEKGVERVDSDGKPFKTQLNYTLEKLADEINEEVSRMRLKGTFTYMADAKTFQPCGSRFTWPCAGGMDWGAEEGELLNSMNGADLEKAYGNAVKQGGDPWTVEVECSLGMGPAMEGDGADEYLFIHKVLNAQATCP